MPVKLDPWSEIVAVHFDSDQQPYIAHVEYVSRGPEGGGPPPSALFDLSASPETAVVTVTSDISTSDTNPISGAVTVTRAVEWNVEHAQRIELSISCQHHTPTNTVVNISAFLSGAIYVDHDVSPLGSPFEAATVSGAPGPPESGEPGGSANAAAPTTLNPSGIILAPSSATLIIDQTTGPAVVVPASRTI